MWFSHTRLPLIGLTVASLSFTYAPPAEAQTPVRLSGAGLALSTPSGYRSLAAGTPQSKTTAIYVAQGPNVNGFNSNINIQTESVPYSTLPSNFEAIVARTMQHQLAPRSNNLKVLSNKRGTLGGLPALEVISSFQLKGKPIRERISQVFVVRNSRLFTITFSTEDTVFAQQYPVFGKFLRSVNWLPVAGVPTTPTTVSPGKGPLVVPIPKIKIATPPPQ